jgi:hypothetical protein
MCIAMQWLLGRREFRRILTGFRRFFSLRCHRNATSILATRPRGDVMSPTEYEYLFILDALERKEPIFPFIVKALEDSGLVDISEQGISLTPAGQSLMQQLSDDENAWEQRARHGAH